MTTTTREARITERLREAFMPAVLEVRDDSAMHAGHAGNPEGGGETHYTVHLVSARFAGMSRVARSRLVHSELSAEFASGLHALALRLEIPDEKS